MTTVLEPTTGTAADAFVASAAGPDVDFDAGPLAAAPPSISLISSAQDVTALLDARYGTDRWLNGIVISPEVGAVSLTGDFPYWWGCPEAGGDLATARSPGGVKQVPDRPGNVTVRPLVAHVADPCISAGGSETDAQARARRALEANFPRIVEDELWTGARASMAGFTNPALAQDVTSTLVSGQQVGYVSALEELEQALASGDNRDGFIHATRRLVTLWIAENLVVASPTGKRLQTLLGTTVVPGVGYPGTGPLAQPATRLSQWAYATGPVVYARNGVRYLQEYDRTINDRITRAEQDFVVFWDKKVDAVVKVDLTTRTS